MTKEKKYYTAKANLVFKTLMIDEPKILEKIKEAVPKEKLVDLGILNSKVTNNKYRSKVT